MNGHMGSADSPVAVHYLCGVIVNIVAMVQQAQAMPWDDDMIRGRRVGTADQLHRRRLIR
jgi:hypothetical protein